MNTKGLPTVGKTGYCMHLQNLNSFTKISNLPTLLSHVLFYCAQLHQGVRLGRKTYLVDMAQGNKRTDYVAVSNTVIGVLLLMLGSIGLLESFLSTAELILLYSLLGFCGAISALFLPKIE